MLRFLNIICLALVLSTWIDYNKNVLNQRNDEINNTVIDELNFLRSIHEGNELDLSLLEARDVSMNSRDESENVVANIDDYETVIYDYANRGLEPTSVNDPEPIKADIINTIMEKALQKYLTQNMIN